MADIKLKSVDKNRIGEYIGEYRSVMEGALQVLYRLKRLK